jgi:ATP synthase protein I
MPKPDESPEAPHSLEARLDAFEAERARRPSPMAARLVTGQGYRFLGEVVGGVFGGAGLGWLVDRFTNTTPLGLICGLLIGTGISVFAAMKSAMKANKTAAETTGPLPAVPDEDDED